VIYSFHMQLGSEGTDTLLKQKFIRIINFFNRNTQQNIFQKETIIFSIHIIFVQINVFFK
jgi:hypothetical protein